MSFETVVVLLFAVLSLLPLLGVLRSNRRAAAAVLIVCGALGAAIASIGPGTANFRTHASAARVRHRPVAVEVDGYVSSDRCRSCHAREYATWHASYHRTMTQVVGPGSVLADFGDATPAFGGRKYRFFERDGRYFAEVTPSIDGRKSREEYECVLSTGSHHMQVFWYANGQGRSLTRFPLAFLLSEQRWLPFDSTFLRPPGTHQMGRPGEWNMSCIACHTTHAQPRFQFRREGSLARSDLDDVDTHVGEFGIACEACHGPGSRHVREAKSPWKRLQLHRDQNVHEDTVNPAGLPPQRGSQVCGHCHSVTVPRTAEDVGRILGDGCGFRPGDDLLAGEDRDVVEVGADRPGIELALAREPDFLRTRFWSDGMVRVTGREYNGLLESPCYTHGDETKGMLSCMSCHQMHQLQSDPRPRRQWADDQLKVGMRGNAACTQCHADFVGEEALDRHTHHPVTAKEGRRCYNCHMPYTTYGLLKAIRSHTVSSPSVQESLRTGRPNACNGCHLDKTLAWTAGHLERWYVVEQPELLEDERQIAASVLWTLRGDAGQRALMAWSMGWPAARRASGEAWLPPYLAQLMTDPYDAVRYIAYRSLKRISGDEQLSYDFLSASDQQGIVRRVETMQATALRQIGHRPELLIGPDGAIDRGRRTQLLRQRDTRPVLLNE